jgi:hypothetical protein
MTPIVLHPKSERRELTTCPFLSGALYKHKHKKVKVIKLNRNQNWIITVHFKLQLSLVNQSF